MNYDNWKQETPPRYEDEKMHLMKCDRCDEMVIELFPIQHFMPPEKGGDELELICKECLTITE